MGRYHTMVTQFKRYIITEELIKQKYNVCATARILQIHRNSLSRMIEELEIDLDAGRMARKSKEQKVDGVIEERSVPIAKLAKKGSVSSSERVTDGTTEND